MTVNLHTGLFSRLTFAIVVAATCVAAVALPSAARAAMTPASNAYVVAGATTPVLGMQVSGYDGKDVLVSVTTNAGSLAIPSTPGVQNRFGFTSQGAELLFYGAQGAVNATLAQLTITTAHPPTPLTGPATTATPIVIRGMATEYRDTLTYRPENQHFYKYVPLATCVGDPYGCDATERAAHSFAAAQAGAEASTELGLKGYLATITSAEENAFVTSKIEGAKNVYFGATDDVEIGVWKWSGGPEKGTTFWTGCPAGNDVHPGVPSGYSNWGKGQPDNYGSHYCRTGDDTDDPTGERCAVTNWDRGYPDETEGFWNDLPCAGNATVASWIGGYVVEYGNKAAGGDYVGFDTVEATIAGQLPVTVPAPNLLANLFTLIGKPVAKVVRTRPNKPAKFRVEMTGTMRRPGTYLVYLKRPNGLRIPFAFQPGSKVVTGGKMIRLRKRKWELVVTTTTADQQFVVQPVVTVRDWTKPKGTRLFFVLKAPNEDSRNQMCMANWCQAQEVPIAQYKRVQNADGTYVLVGGT